MQRFTLWSVMRLNSCIDNTFVGRCAGLITVLLSLAIAPMANALTSASLTAANLAGKTLTFSITGGNAPFETIGNFDLVLGSTATYSIAVSNGNTTARSGSYTVSVDSFGTVIKLNGYVVNSSTVEVVIIPNTSADRSTFEMYATGANKNGNVVFATSTTTTTTPPTTLTISSDAQSVFDLATELYPALFKDGSALQSYQGYTYKYFATSKIYVGIKDNTVYLMGGQFGSAITSKGSVSSVLTDLQTAKINISKPTPAIPVVVKPTTPVVTTPTTSAAGGGLYKLSMTGTVIIMGVSTPVSIIVLDQEAPEILAAANDVSSTLKELEADLQDSSFSNITNLKATIINATATRATFRLAFTATLDGVGAVTYDLTYDLSPQ